MKKFISLMLILFLINLVGFSENITFGAYYQEYAIDSKKAPIEWIILDETDDSYLLLSKYALDANRFGSMLWPCFWYNSDIRSFLNNEFYKEAFSYDEQERIITSHLYTQRNCIYANGTKDFYTNDKVFLLSIEEVEQYILTAEVSIAYVTPFARIGHVRKIGDNWGGVSANKSGATCWWLRSNGITEYYGAFVNAQGRIVYEGEMVYAPHYAVRPAIWIKK